MNGKKDSFVDDKRVTRYLSTIQKHVHVSYKTMKIVFLGHKMDDVEMQIYVSNRLRLRTTVILCLWYCTGRNTLNLVRFPVCTSAYICRTQYSAVKYIHDFAFCYKLTKAPHCTNSFMFNMVLTSCTNYISFNLTQCFSHFCIKSASSYKG